MASSRSSAPSAPPADPLLGREAPRLFTPPRRPLTRETSHGFEACDFAEGVLGVRLMPWQRWLLHHALELNEDGTYRFRTVVVLVARQNGKTTIVQIVALWRMFVDGAGLVIGTAQNLDVAEEAWMGAVEMVEGVPELAAEIAAVDRTNGKKSLRLTTGPRYKVQAASRRGGRGLSGDLVVLDELREHQSWDAWAAVTKTTMARARPQVWGLSNAGDASSVVLSHLRGQAVAAIESGEDSTIGLFEWSAPQGCDVTDADAWAHANPGLGHTITADALASAASTDPDAVFRTEGLCQWVERVAPPVIDPVQWEACRDDRSSFAGVPVFGLAASWDLESAAVVAAGLRADGLAHVEVVEHLDGATWAAARCKELTDRHGGAILVAPRSPAVALVPDLAALGVPVKVAKSGEVPEACAGFAKDVADGSMRMMSHPGLDAAVAGARRKESGDTWTWSRRDSSVDITPLQAATLALHGVRSGPSGDPGMYFL